MAKRKKKGPSKVGSSVNVKGYRRKVGKLPPRTSSGRFRRGSGGRRGGGGQTTLF